ncbi:hypothetical protein AVEN_222146-1, partial [Araneus ventricosus]
IGRIFQKYMTRLINSMQPGPPPITNDDAAVPDATINTSAAVLSIKFPASDKDVNANRNRPDILSNRNLCIHRPPSSSDHPFPKSRQQLSFLRH